MFERHLSLLGKDYRSNHLCARRSLVKLDLAISHRSHVEFAPLIGIVSAKRAAKAGEA
jgi:hypothetical protein